MSVEAISDNAGADARGVDSLKLTADAMVEKNSVNVEAVFDMSDGLEMTLSRDAVFKDMELAKNVDEGSIGRRRRRRGRTDS